MNKKMFKLARFAKKSFKEFPIITNSLIFGTLAVGAELSQQTLLNKVLLARFAKKSFKEFPIITNSLIFGTLAVGAELSQQTLLNKVLADVPKPLDYPTLVRYSISGTLIQGPILTVWYQWLDSKFVGTALKVVSKKILVDQSISVPPILAIFFVSMSIMEGKEDIFEECRSKFWETFVGSFWFWVPVQAINFFLVSPAFRVIYTGFACFAWNNVLCYVKRKEYSTHKT